MCEFVKLTTLEEDEIWVNMDKAQTLWFDDEAGYTHIVWENSIAPFYVKETPQDILLRARDIRIGTYYDKAQYGG